MRKNLTVPSRDEIVERLSYDPETGVFRWRITDRRAKAGDVAGVCNSPLGHRRIGLNNRSYMAHRLAWLYMTGDWPPQAIDHINGIPDDNRWSNLRAATPAENARNRRCAVTNRSGYKGVRMVAEGRYQARIWRDGRRVVLGIYDTPEEAHAAYARAAAAHFGAFSNDGTGCTVPELLNETQARSA